MELVLSDGDVFLLFYIISCMPTSSVVGVGVLSGN